MEIEVGDRVGTDVPLAHGRALLKVWLARLVTGEPQPLEHASLRWLSVDELDSVPWLPADAPIVAELARIPSSQLTLFCARRPGRRSSQVSVTCPRYRESGDV